MFKFLNYKLEGKGKTIILIHGLFGNLDNLGMLARNFKIDHQILSIDLRNHGFSFHNNQHNYEVMASDIFTLITKLNLSTIKIIGHSMGGKVAMKVAELMQNQISKLVILDIAPVKYSARTYDNTIDGIQAVKQEQPKNRKDALSILRKYIQLKNVRQFLGKSLYSNKGIITWRFNSDSIIANYEHILDWTPVALNSTPTLFLKGMNSSYLLPKHRSLLKKQVSNFKIHVIANTGHWLHAENPFEVIKVIRTFFKEKI
ncbi:esterase/lipase [Candidatus Photodesmus blepharus]|uniref:Esterase/lipase n=1 Tax=Candidatus Photodesmus blepharonis TaxID=1179155 RepID=A0A084CMZ9_9GAMM|nr:alpha/beta fold hydrolase [Candidatus Photodesmus blepharus]KEY91178.1 esterase/lipase [Candidatus Photodesmus blepharus]